MANTSRGPVLSPSERHLLRMVEAGAGGLEMAQHLGEPLTVTAGRMHRIRERLDVSSTAQAVAIAQASGLLGDAEGRVARVEGVAP